MKLLATKRGQPVRAQVEMVRLCMTWIEGITQMDQKLKYIDTIKSVCDKKIYLEHAVLRQFSECKSTRISIYQDFKLPGFSESNFDLQGQILTFRVKF